MQLYEILMRRANIDVSSSSLWFKWSAPDSTIPHKSSYRSLSQFNCIELEHMLKIRRQTFIGNSLRLLWLQYICLLYYVCCGSRICSYVIEYQLIILNILNYYVLVVYLSSIYVYCGSYICNYAFWDVITGKTFIWN